MQSANNWMDVEGESWLQEQSLLITLKVQEPECPEALVIAVSLSKPLPLHQVFPHQVLWPGQIQDPSLTIRHLASLCLSFHIYKMRMIVTTTRN